MRLSALGAHLVGATFGLAAALGYDARFWLGLRGGEVTLSGPRFAAAVAHAFALAWPIALCAAIIGAILERIAFRATTPALVRPTRFFVPAPDAVADAFVTTAAAGVAFVAVHRFVLVVETNLHSPEVIALVVAAVAPMIVVGVLALRAAAMPPFRRFMRGLDKAASPILFYAVTAAALLAARMRFTEVDPNLDRSVPWYTVYTFVAGGVVHLLVAFAPPRVGRGARRARAAGLALAFCGVAGTTTSILTYDKTTSHRFFVEEISWIGTRAHRVWAELLDRDGDGHPARLGGGDCNDRRRDVYPGAVDQPGDGIDSDCFGGDGTPPFHDQIPMELSPRTIDDGPLNVLMISIDTMRPDRLHAAGERREVTPRINALQRESVWFRDVTSPSPRTVRSLPAVFTGQYPGAIEYERSLGRVDMAPINTTLAEIASTRMDTRAILGTSYFRENLGLLQGFANVEHANSMKPPPDWTTDQALAGIARMRNSPRPTLLWVHYFGAHEPYLGDRFPSRFGQTQEGAYDTELWRADHEVGRLLDALSMQGLDRNTAVVLFSDHGESLGEHGAWGHSTRLNEEQVRSVLMIRAPRLAPRVVDTPVALFDLFPTVLDLSNVAPPTPISARNLMPLARGEPNHDRMRPIFSEVMPDAIYAIETQSIRLGNEKVIYWPRTQRASYFDLRSDPHELHDLADTHRSTTRRLLGTLLSWNVATHRDENRISAIIRNSIVSALPSDATRLDAAFGNGITLLGARIGNTNPSRDTPVDVDLYFRADRPITSDYFIHLTFDPADGVSNAAAFVAHHTAIDGSYPTSLWRRGEIIRDRVKIRIPATLQPNVLLVGHVELWSHFHVRMPVAAQQGGIVVDTIDVGTLTVR